MNQETDKPHIKPGAYEPLLWLERLQHDQEIQNKQIGELTKNVSALTSTVEAIVIAQRDMFSRANRPYPWGAVVGGFTLLGILAGLLVAPIQAALDRHDGSIMLLHELNRQGVEYHLKEARDEGAQSANIEWLMKMENRLDVHMDSHSASTTHNGEQHAKTHKE